MISDNTASVAVAIVLCSLVVAPLASTGVVAGTSASFDDTTVSGHRGDVIEITVHTSADATVNIGSQSDGFWVQANVTKGTTTLALNTYRADDPNESVTLVKGGLRGSPTVKTPSETGPLQSGVYDMNVTVDGVRQDVGSFTVKERETGDARTLVLPKDADLSEFHSTNDDDDPAAALRAAAASTENGTIARGDQFVLALDASGLGGFIEGANLNGGAENVSVTFREANNEPNTVPHEFGGGDVNRDEPERLLWDEENDQLYLIVDTASHDIEVGDEYEVTFEIGAGNPTMTEAETAKTSFNVVERRVTLDYDGDVLVVANETTIRGETTLAPGTTINVTAFDKGDHPFFWPKEPAPIVTENRTLSATFDFSEITPGTEFTVELRDQGKTIRGVVASTPTNPSTTTTTMTTNTTTTTTTTTANTTNTSTTVTESPPTRIPTEQPITAQTASEGGLPGFDITAALVALVATALLVARRFQ